MEIPPLERMLGGLFLCSQSSNELLHHVRPEWDAAIQPEVDKRLSFLQRVGLNIHPEEIYPLVGFSEGIAVNDLAKAQFIQPDLFIRIRPGCKKKVLARLEKAGLKYRFIPPHSVALPNSVRLQEMLKFDEEVIVQDLSSQRTWEFIPDIGKNGSVWDCCAGSGGKSFLVKDKLGNVPIAVSDIRSSILVNLERRFRTGGIDNYEMRQMDLRSAENITHNVFDLIIADVPCTGSGTWSRTPEQLYFFSETSVKEFRQLQSTITANIVPALKPGGFLLYITCSVFSEENEQVVEQLTRKENLKIIRQDTIRGYHEKADTMFACLLQKV